jgi:hypothetical protein
LHLAQLPYLGVSRRRAYLVWEKAGTTRQITTRQMTTRQMFASRHALKPHSFHPITACMDNLVRFNTQLRHLHSTWRGRVQDTDDHAAEPDEANTRAEAGEEAANIAQTDEPTLPFQQKLKLCAAKLETARLTGEYNLSSHDRLLNSTQPRSRSSDPSMLKLS